MKFYRKAGNRTFVTVEPGEPGEPGVTVRARRGLRRRRRGAVTRVDGRQREPGAAPVLRCNRKTGGNPAEP